MLQDLRAELYGRLLRWPPTKLEAQHSGELTSRLTSDVAQVEFTVTQALTSYVKDGLTVIALLGLCLALDARLFVVAFIALPLAILPVSRFAKGVKRVARKTQASLGALSTLLAEQLNNLAVVKAYDGHDRALEHFDVEQSRYLVAMQRSLFIRGAFTPVLETLGFLGVALAISFGARAVSKDASLSGHLLSFLTATLLLYQPIKSLSGTFSLVMQGLGAAERLFELEDQEVPTDRGAPAAPLVQGLRLEGLTVRYDAGGDVLRRLTLEVPAGKRVALVGKSGGGKTTLLATLLGFVEPSEGRVTWDGVDVQTLSRASLRTQMAWVPQEPVLFSGSVRDNLLLASPGATDAELWDALGQASATDFVAALPSGLEEPVGERGGRLSGGQRQRLAIARAFLRRPSVLLLDEPTSALDAASEQGVQAGLASLMAGRTVLVVAHRLATVRDADLIYVLERGEVVESGTHATLVARGGRYAALLQGGALTA